VHEDIGRKVQQIVRKKLAGATVVPRQLGSRFGKNDADGYFETDDGKRVYVIRSKAFRAWLPVKAQQVAALRWLLDGGYLQTPKRPMTSVFTIGGKTDVLEQQPRWPDGDNPRCFVFADPFGREG
jgi:hypothetical protein